MRTIDFTELELLVVRASLSERREAIVAMLDNIEQKPDGYGGAKDGLIAVLKGNLLGVDVVLAKLEG